MSKVFVTHLGLLPRGGVERIRMAHFNTAAEVRRLIESLDRVLEQAGPSDRWRRDLHRRLPRGGVVRISMAHFNTAAEVRRLIDSLDRVL